MMPHLCKHASLPADAGQRSHSSVVRPSLPGQPASQPSFFLRRRPAPALRALPLRLSPVLTLPPTCQSAEEEREKAVCVPTRAAKRDAPRHATAALPLSSRSRTRGGGGGWDGTGLDWTGLRGRLGSGVAAWGGSARIHPFLPQADATRAAPEADANHPVPVLGSLALAQSGRRRGRAAEPARAAARGVRLGSLRGPLQTDGGWGEDLQPRPPETAGPTTPPSCVGLC